MSGRSIIITLLVLIAYAAASFVQLPSLNMVIVGELLAMGSADAFARTSIVALGILPWLSVCILLETIATLIPPARRLPLFGGTCINVFHPIVIGLSLLVAALQAYGVSTGLQGAGLLQAPVDTINQISIIASLVGGTALTIIAGRIIDKDGIGYGFWTMLAVGFVSVMVGAFASVSQLVIQGVVSDNSFLLEMLIVSVAICAIVWLTTLLLRSGANDIGLILWPSLVAVQLAGLLVGGLLFIFPEMEFITAQSGIRIISILLAAISVVLIAVFAWLSMRRADAKALALPSALVVIALFLTPYIFELTSSQSNFVWRILSPLGEFIATIALLTIIAIRLIQVPSSSSSTTRNLN